MTTIVKQPAEHLHPTLAFPSPISAVLATTVAARGLVLGAPALVATPLIAAGLVSMTLAGGGDGERYLVTCRAQSVDGEELEAELEVAVIEAAWSLPDGGRPYVSIADFVDRYTLDEVVKMTDGDGSGRIDRALLTRKLADAQAEVDAHLVGRYTLPLAVVPPIVALIVSDLARAKLYPRGAPEGIDTSVKAATGYLARIQSGAMPLAVPGAGAPPPAANPEQVLISPGRTRYVDDFGEGY